MNEPAQPSLESISAVALGVRDMARSVRFYERLGCRRTHDRIVSGAHRERRGQHEQSSVEPMDLGRVQLDAERAVRAEMRPVVDLSKAEALGLIGEPEQGYALVAATCGRRRVRA